jgi:hypothetical protein
MEDFDPKKFIAELECQNYGMQGLHMSTFSNWLENQKWFQISSVEQSLTQMRLVDTSLLMGNIADTGTALETCCTNLFQNKTCTMSMCIQAQVTEVTLHACTSHTVRHTMMHKIRSNKLGLLENVVIHTYFFYWQLQLAQF